MIKLNNVNKYFNKGKRNENHVVNNINLELPETGLVIILGKSGSGKTTLLNIISGTDDFNKGTLTIDNKVIEKYKSRIWDTIRNKDIGYVFQNYNLFNNLTVYGNIEFVLKLSGVREKDEIKKRVDYLLESVGLENYHNRLVSSLSGGQAQRVALVRALAKNPKIIVADEPTGNLDSKNTIDIMNILKVVSKKKLVLMVSHDISLAEYYADRIISIQDGLIVNDDLNEYDGVLEIEQDQQIFLKDYQKETLNSNNVDLTTYNNENSSGAIDIELIDKNETLYLKVDSKKHSRIKYLNDESEIELINDFSCNKNNYLETDFDFDNIIDNKSGMAKISIKDSFDYALKKISELSIGSKMLYSILALVGALMSLSIGIYGSVNDYDDTLIVDKSRNYIIVEGDYTYDEAKALEEYDYIKKVNFFTEAQDYKLSTETYYQISNSITLNAHPSDISLLSNDNIIYGRYPEKNEIVIDKFLADGLMYKYSERGIDSYEDVLKSRIKLQSDGNEFDYSIDTYFEFDIVGISNDDSPTIWMSEELLYSLSLPTMVDYTILGDGVEFSNGRMPRSFREVLLSDDYSNVGTPSQIGTSLGTLSVVGTYSYNAGLRNYNTKYLMLSDVKLMEKMHFARTAQTFFKTSVLAYTDNPAETIQKLDEEGIYAYSDYLDNYDEYIADQTLANTGFLTYSLIGIISAALGIYFIMRSSLLSRIYEISILRAVGASKSDIRRLFLVEILFITTISSLVGYLALILLLSSGLSNAKGYIDFVHFTFINAIIGALILYLVNIIFGLIPIELLIRKTPSKILSRYDL
ncbi:ATP-binding cassette domain-containing protein [Mycoplasmatota bacterium WC44]